MIYDKTIPKTIIKIKTGKATTKISKVIITRIIGIKISLIYLKSLTFYSLLLVKQNYLILFL